MSDNFGEALLWLRELNSDQQEEFASLCDNCKPALTVEGFAANIIAEFGTSSSSGITALLSLLSGFAEAVADSSDFAKQVSEVLDGSDDQEIAPLLEKIVSSEALLVTKKAQDVMWGHGRVFKASRVISQIRPIFYNDVERDPLNAVIVHELRIDAMSGDQAETWRVAMDSKRAKKLIEVLQRAIQKEEQLKNSASSTFSYLS